MVYVSCRMFNVDRDDMDCNRDSDMDDGSVYVSR